MNAHFSERGSYLVQFIFLFIVVSAVAGLATDAGRLYATQVRLQAAIDAGVVAGMTLPRDASEDRVRETARVVIDANLSERGLDPTRAQLSLELNSGIIEANGTYDVDLILSRAFLTGESQSPVHAYAEGGPGVLALALVLDTTGSMSAVDACDPEEEDPEVNPEGCWREDYPDIFQGATDGCPRICYLQRAARRLVYEFHQRASEHDRLAIVRYARTASMALRFTRIDNDAGFTSAIAAINSLNNPDGSTCIACGIREARNHFSGTQLPRLAARYMVVMTDGAANEEDTISTTGCGLGRSNVPEEVYDVREASYQAIVESDQARHKEKITVYSVGLGQPLVPFGQHCEMPYQENTGSTNDPGACPGSVVREPLLKRIANHRHGLEYEFVPRTNLPPEENCAYDYPETTNCACIPRMGTRYRPGEYFATDEASGLADLFSDALATMQVPRLRK